MSIEKNSNNISESKISIICPSPNGREIALKLQNELGALLYIKQSSHRLEESNIYKCEETNRISDEHEVTENRIYESEKFKLHEITKAAMKNSTGIIFISSTGIAVRAIAPFLEGKEKDPGVVVVDLSCKYAINIISGHLGGGNELTLKVSEILNTIPIITTASDNLGIIAPDVLAKQHNLIIEDLKKAKYIASLLVDNKLVGIKDDFGIIPISKGYELLEELRNNCIWITHNIKYEFQTNIPPKVDYSKVLRLIRKDVILGIGCRKDTSYEKLKEFINNNLTKYNLDKRSIAGIVSVDIKANENGIIKLAESLNCPFTTYNREEIKTVQDKYEKSEFVFKTLGVTGVCEPCVDLAGAHVIKSKIKYEGMTLAIGILNNIM